MRTYAQAISINISKEPIISLILNTPLVQLALSIITEKSKTMYEGILKKLIKGMKELRIKMSELKKDQKSGSSQPIKGQKNYIMRCIWCNDTNHSHKNCTKYVRALKDGKISFKERRIKNATIDFPLDINFGKSGIKKLMED